MISFMFIVSFLLHIIVLIVVFQLFKQVQMLKQENTRDIMDVFDVYLQEIKDENKQLQDEILKKSPQIELEPSYSTSKPFVTSYHGQASSKAKNENNTQLIPPTENKDDHLSTSLQAKVLQLYDRGLSEETIARKLNRGKTEVSLIINIYEKKKS